MTSLIDVIFLLLLFFMLSSTFSKFSEIDLSAAGPSSAAASSMPPLFLSLHAETLSLNGQTVALDSLRTALASQATAETPRTVLISPAPDVTAQRLTDLLVALHGAPGITTTVLGGAT